MNSKFKLKEVCEITSSKRIFAHEYTESGIPFYRSKEIIELSNEQQIREPLFISKERFNEIKKKFNIPQNGDILLSAIGANLGIPYLVNLDFEFYFKDGNVIWFRNFSPKIDSEYLFWWMNTNYFFKQFTDKAIGAAQKALTIDSLNDYLVEVPGIKEQRDITKVLRVISKKIILNNRINIELEAMVKTLYNYWFVQFDFPSKNGKPYKSTGCEMVWNDELKRNIPVGWDVADLLHNPFTRIIKPGIEEFEGEKIYLATADINNKEIESGNKITFKERETRANMQPVENSVWFAKMKASKKHLFIGEFGEDIIKDVVLSTGFLGLNCESRAFEFIASFVASDVFENIKDTVSHGATMQGIGNDDLKLIKIVVPNEDILTDFKQVTGTIYKKLDLMRNENQKLSELRDWLLPMLMNGQIKVK